MTEHTIVPHTEWLNARKRLLARERELQHLRDELARERRALPWERVEKRYVFEAEGGRRTLEQLFEGRSQLLVYHFMFAPDWEAGCKGCSFWADSYNGNDEHLAARDVTLVAVSRAPLEKLLAFRARMGWRFRWVSSEGNDFNFDYQVSFRAGEGAGAAAYNYAPIEKPPSDLPGFSAFFRDPDGTVFHTYSTYARGLDPLNATYQMLDLMPKGRDEDALPQPFTWLRHRDRYGS